MRFLYRFLYGSYVVSLAVLTGLTFRAHVAHPPHVAPPVAEVLGSLPLAAVGGDQPGQVIADVIAWIEGVERAEEEARVAAARSTPVVRVAPPGAPDCAGIPDWFPSYIAWRESRCTRGLDTSNGYYSFAQIAGFHWFGGICDGLTWTDPAQEDECVDRLSQHGTRLGPWGG